MVKLLAIFLLSLLLPEIAVAGNFTPAPYDKSVDLLGVIFGSHIGAVYLGGAPNPALAHMFEIFNVVVICIGTIILSYIGIVSTINTAQEGQTMGKKWSSIWIPLRAALGMMALVPTPASGYSVIQATVIWIILQGVGAADQLWNKVLLDLGRGLSAGTAIQRPKEDREQVALQLAIKDRGLELSEALLRSAVCMQTLNHSNGNHNVKYHSTYAADRNMAAIYIGVPNAKDREFIDICGRYEISATVSDAEWAHAPSRAKKAREILEHKEKAISTMFDMATNLAKVLVSEEMGPRRIDGRLAELQLGEMYHPGFIAGYKAKIAETYQNTLSAMVIPNVYTDPKNILRSGMRNGWISAASFYFAINKQNELDLKNFATLSDAVQMQNIPRCDNFESCSLYVDPHAENLLNAPVRNLIRDMEHKNLMATRLFDASVYLDQDGANAEEAMLINDIHHDEHNEVQKLAIEGFTSLLKNQDPDPLIAQTKFGRDLMSYIEGMWLKKSIEADVRIAHAREHGQEGNQEVLTAIHNLLKESRFGLDIYGLVWGMAAILAIYVPLIPYMMFIVAAIGWLLLVIEAVVAAPMLALSFIIPSGEELGKVAQGMMILLNIVLRPCLMLFGFILATRLYKAVIQLVNFSLAANFNQLEIAHSMYAWAAMLAIYIGFILALSNKCFALIYGLPDKVLRWMGSPGEHTDASQELQQAKGGLSKGTELTTKITGGAAKDQLAGAQGRLQQLAPPDAVNI